jgi:hypothetical protein
VNILLLGDCLKHSEGHDMLPLKTRLAKETIGVGLILPWEFERRSLGMVAARVGVARIPDGCTSDSEMG